MMMMMLMMMMMTMMVLIVVVVMMMTMMFIILPAVINKLWPWESVPLIEQDSCHLRSIPGLNSTVMMLVLMYGGCIYKQMV